MALGKKVFDIYGELHLDKDEVRQGLRGLAGEMGPEADKAGQDLGKRMTDGLARSVEASSAKVAKARRAEVDAANAVKVAELRLNEAREKGNKPASQMLALENALEKAHYRLATAQSNTVTSTKKLEDSQRLLAKSMGDAVDKDLGPRMQKSGDDAGGKLAMGMRMSVVRNSPLIVTAIAGGLAAGAPVLSAAAVGLFAGVGIVAAAQSDKVQQAWLGTWNEIKDGTIASAADIEPALTRVAGNVGAAFERMQPQISAAFSASAPQIEVFARGVTDLAENALPGMVHAVEAGMPVTRGLADLLGKTGTGLSDMFDRISAHGPAAGQVFSDLGDTTGILLPLLGELVGEGAELGATVLPMLNGGLGLALSVVEHLGGALPVVVGYFSSMKILSTAGGWAESLGGKLTALGAKDIPLVSAAAGKMGGALTTAGSAAVAGGVVTGALAATLGLLMAAHQASQERIRAWTQALGEGGAAARAAREEMSAQDAQVRGATSGWQGFVTSMSLAAPALNEMKGETEAADEANRKYVAGLSPLEAAQRNSKIAEQELGQALKDHHASSDEVTAAAARYRAAQHEVEVQSGLVEKAIHGVTQAMIDQANQAMGSISADFAYQDALDDLETKQNDLAVAIRDHGKASEEASDAQRAYAEGIWDTAQKAAAASPMLAGLKEGTVEYDRAVQNLTLKSLVDMRAGLGPEMRAVVDGMIAKLQAGGASLDELGAKKPTPTVSLNDGPFLGLFEATKARVADLAGQTPTPVANLNKGPLDAGFYAALGNLAVLNGQRPTPTPVLNNGPFEAVFGAVMGRLGTINGQRPSPVATLYANTGAAEAALNYAARNRTAVITTLYNTSNARGMALGGKVGDAIRRFDVGGSPRRRQDGRISGPGGPWDDLVPAVTSMGEHIRVANDEWIVPGFVSAMQGDARMAALTAGRADIVPRLPGRLPARSFGAASTSSSANPATGTGQPNSGPTFHIGSLVVKIETPLNLMNSQDLRRAGAAIRDVILKLEKEYA